MGIMLYTLICGKLPFDREKVSDKKFIDNVMKADISYPKGMKFSAEVKDLIKNMLKKNPKDRIPMKKIIEHPFLTGRKIK
jgi:aurora kinase